jgi:hypothetical protein
MKITEFLELETYLTENGFTVFRNATGPVDVIDGRTLAVSTAKVKSKEEFVNMLRQRQFKNISLYSIPSEGTIRFAGWK